MKKQESGCFRESDEKRGDPRPQGGTLPEEKTFHMSSEDLRRHGHAVVDWIADYYKRIETLPVLSRAEPGQIRASLPPNAPAKGESFEAILRDVEKLILPGITHWQSPNFYAFFPCNASGPAVLGDLLSSGLGVQGMLWATSPACTELETHVLDWLVPMLGLPEKFLSTSSGGGVIQDTASSASLCALLAARERATNFASNKKGCDGHLAAYTSTQAHSSIEKDVPVSCLASSAPLWARLHRTALIPFMKSAAFAESAESGSTSTPPCLAPPRSVQSSVTFTTDSSSPTVTASTRTSGCLRISTVTASTWPIARL